MSSVPATPGPLPGVRGRHGEHLTVPASAPDAGPDPLAVLPAALPDVPARPGDATEAGDTLDEVLLLPATPAPWWRTRRALLGYTLTFLAAATTLAVMLLPQSYGSASDRQAQALMAELAAELRNDPAAFAADVPDGVEARYLPRQGSAIAGELQRSVAGGTCWVVTVHADVSWLGKGDPSGLRVSEPERRTGDACRQELPAPPSPTPSTP